jgi:hypothetical protein
MNSEVVRDRRTDPTYWSTTAHYFPAPMRTAGNRTQVRGPTDVRSGGSGIADGTTGLLLWRNWRKRAFNPAAAAVCLETSRPYDLRHSFASLLIHEGRYSIVEIAQQLGHNPNVCLSTYAHVMAELQDERGTSAEQQIRLARTGPQRARDEPLTATPGPKPAHEPAAGSSEDPNPQRIQEALCRTRTGDPFLTMEVLYQLS